MSESQVSRISWGLRGVYNRIIREQFQGKVMCIFHAVDALIWFPGLLQAAVRRTFQGPMILFKSQTKSNLILKWHVS